MTKIWLVATALFLAACGGSDATVAGDGALSAKTCIDLEHKPDSRFADARQCFESACAAGDEESCLYAESYQADTMDDEAPVEPVTAE